MKILIAYYSKTGHTTELALLITQQLKAQGHEIDFEKIEPEEEDNRWTALWRTQWYQGAIGMGIFSKKYREYFIKNYKIPEVNIKPLTHQDVSKYDRICIGCPKHTLVPSAIERYLRQVDGLNSKKVGIFATWAGPPLKHFEKEHLFRPIADRLERRGSQLVSIMGLTSSYNEYYVMPIFELISKLRFGKPLKEFGVDSKYCKSSIEFFCDELEKGTTDVKESMGWRRSFNGVGIFAVATASNFTTLKFIRDKFTASIIKKENRRDELIRKQKDKYTLLRLLRYLASLVVFILGSIHAITLYDVVLNNKDAPLLFWMMYLSGGVPGFIFSSITIIKNWYIGYLIALMGCLCGLAIGLAGFLFPGLGFMALFPGTLSTHSATEITFMGYISVIAEIIVTLLVAFLYKYRIWEIDSITGKKIISS